MAEQMKRVGTELPWKSGSGVPPTGRLEHVVERRTLSRGNRLLMKGGVLMLEVHGRLKPGECTLSWLMKPSQLVELS